MTTSNFTFHPDHAPCVSITTTNAHLHTVTLQDCMGYEVHFVFDMREKVHDLHFAIGEAYDRWMGNDEAREAQHDFEAGGV